MRSPDFFKDFSFPVMRMPSLMVLACTRGCLLPRFCGRRDLEASCTSSSHGAVPCKTNDFCEGAPKLSSVMDTRVQPHLKSVRCIGHQEKKDRRDRLFDHKENTEAIS